MKVDSELSSAILRVAFGIMFLAHGLLKLVVFGLSGTAGFFDSVGFPGWLAYVVTPLEIVAGILLIIGFQARRVSLAMIPILLGALYVHIGNGWVFSSPNGGWEYPLFLLVVAVVIILQDNSSYSITNSSQKEIK
jgi:putative oxidoreductase